MGDAKREARFISLDIKDHFYSTPMAKPEYMKVKIKHLPRDIIILYNLEEKFTEDGYIYIRIKKGIPGLKQAEILAYEHLRNIIEPFGYYHIPGTAGLWKHKTRPTVFCLCIDDFG